MGGQCLLSKWSNFPVWSAHASTPLGECDVKDLQAAWKVLNIACALQAVSGTLEQLTEDYTEYLLSGTELENLFPFKDIPFAQEAASVTWFDWIRLSEITANLTCKHKEICPWHPWGLFQSGFL